VTPDPILEAIRKVLAGIAPEADLDALPPDASLRAELDLDSMDFLAFVRGLHRELGVEIPETEYREVGTLRGCAAYLAARAHPKP
jgi:acyl carrier protein